MVWREYRIPGAQNTQKSQPIHSATGGNASTASTLRRERFTFDDIYAGPSACERLMVYSRLRTRQALLYHKPSLVFLTTVCGEDANIYNRRHRNTIIDSNTIEPPVAIVLGDNGDMGLISVVISEIFTTLPHLQSKETQLANRFERKTISNAMKSKTNAKAHNDIKANEPYVTMRACVLLENNTIIDLLCSNQDISAQVNRCSVDRQIHNYNQSGNKYPTKSGKYSKTVVVNATQIQLKKISDFDRIIGVIFGRRAAMNEFLARLAQTSDYPSENTTKMYNANGKEVLMHHLAQSPWLVPNDSASLLITITVHNQTKTRSNNVTDFHFVCPCGQQWSTPCKFICCMPLCVCC